MGIFSEWTKTKWKGRFQTRSWEENITEEHQLKMEQQTRKIQTGRKTRKETEDVKKNGNEEEEEEERNYMKKSYVHKYRVWTSSLCPRHDVKDNNPAATHYIIKEQIRDHLTTHTHTHTHLPIKGSVMGIVFLQWSMRRWSIITNLVLVWHIHILVPFLSWREPYTIKHFAHQRLL